jgi:P2 family phage contractile tail tube protein
VYVRGQAVELDPGEAELGSKSEIKMSYGLTYYRLEVEGVVEVELDFINGIERFGNTDLAQELKRILGL